MRNKTKQILSVSLSVLVSVMLVAGAALAATTIGENIATAGNITVNTNKFIVTGSTGNTTVAGTLGVTGVSTLTGLLNADGGIAVDTSAFTVADTSGNTAIAGTLAVNGATATFGNAVADGVILNGRVSTGSSAGTALTLDSTYTYTEGAELRYTVTDWTGIGATNTFEGLYLRPQVNTAAAAGNLKGIEVNTVNNGVALGSMHGAYLETQVKAIAASATVGPIYGIESQISLYTPTAGTLTLAEQSDVGVAAGRFQLGLPASGLADWTSVYGVLIQSNGGPTQTLGSGLLIRNYPAEGVQTWTKGIQITAPAVTGISLEGAMTTGISIASGGAAITGDSTVTGGTIWQSETLVVGDGVSPSYKGIYANITVPAAVIGGTQYIKALQGMVTSAVSSSPAETWGVYGINNVGGGAIAAYGVVGEINATGTGTVGTGAVNTFLSAGYFHSDVKATMTINGIQDVPLVGIIESSTGRRKADAAVGAVLAGAINQSTAGAGAAFKAYDFNTTAAFDYGLDLYYLSGSYSNVFGTADIRLQNGETIVNSPDGVVAFSGGIKIPKDAASATNASIATTPTGLTCDATTLGTLTWVDDTDTAGAWLWLCEQTGASTYAWKQLGI